MSKHFDIVPTSLPDAVFLRRRQIADTRGYLERLWCDEALGALTGGKPLRQINRTLTRKRGTVRGLHFQRAPHRETKLVQCLRGRIFDVAVDLRAGSATFGQWHGVELSSEEPTTFVIPEGFAHGFQTLSDDCELLYFHTASFAPEAEGGICPTDLSLAIAWPEPITEMSDRDRSHPALDNSFKEL
jgi:dTDP-4-dehydrorhamnose 3,5-epimerase